MSFLGRLFGREDENRLPDEATDDNGAAPAVAEEHKALLAHARKTAEADAIRHAEDLLKREFPIVEEAERMAAARLADLRVTYVETRGELKGEEMVLGQQAEASTQALRQAENALRGAGVSDEQLGLPPGGSRTVSLAQLAAAAALAACGALVISRFSSSPMLVVAAIAGATGLAAWLMFATAEEPEDGEITRLRERRRDEADALRRLEDERARIEAALVNLDRATYAIGQSEIAFADHLAAGYANAAFSALPAGTLEGGRQLPPQRRPDVTPPEWLERLEDRDE